MTKRVLKQLIIISVFFLILLGIGFLIYLSYQPDPTCFDGIQNQEEEKIDCGGPCSSCELREIKEIEILKTEAILNKDNFYDLFAQIKNPNQNYGSGKISYQFRIYNSDGDLINKQSGQTYILPNQIKYLVYPKVNIPYLFNRVEISFDNVEWKKLDNYQVPRLIIQQREYRLLEETEPGFSQTRGVLVNKSSFDFDEINIDILLFNSFNQLVGLNTTELRTLLSGQERDFFTTWFNQIDGEVTSIQMEPETNLFDSDNYLTTGQRMPEKFQEY